MSRKHPIAILLGSNQGERLAYLEEAVKMLHGALKLEALSSIYQTAAWGVQQQSAFLNMAVLAQTDLSPEELLRFAKSAETKLGRIQRPRWQEREIDIDILHIGDLIWQTEELQIPHPALAIRRFSLIPLAEIQPHWIHPILKKDCRQMLEECPDTLAVEKFAPPFHL